MIATVFVWACVICVIVLFVIYVFTIFDDDEVMSVGTGMDADVGADEDGADQ